MKKNNPTTSKKLPSSPKKSKQLTSTKEGFIAAGCYLLLLLILYNTMVFKGYIFEGGDKVETMANVHKIYEYQDKTGEIALWDPYPMGGIPNVFYLSKFTFTIDFFLDKLTLLLSIPLVFFMIGAMGMFFLLRYLKFSSLIAFTGGLIFILIPYYNTLIEVGHFTKLQALMYLPFILLTFLLSIEKSKLLHVVLFAIVFGLQFQTMHFQVCFYTGILLLITGFFPLLNYLLTKNYLTFLKKISLLFVAAAFAVATAAYPMLIAKKYSSMSIRSTWGVDLSKPIDKSQNNGVELKQIALWSISSHEILDFILPHASGGTSSEIYTGTKIPQLKNVTISSYWGNALFNGGYYYMGVIVLLLAFISLFYYRNPLIMGLTLFAALMIAFALGPFLKSFFYFSYDYIPFIKNFRTPITSITMIYFVIAVMASYGMKYLHELITDIPKNRKTAILIFSSFVILVVFYLSSKSETFSFMKSGEKMDPKVLELTVQARKEFYMNDFYRFIWLMLIFSGLTATLLVRVIRFNIYMISLIVLVTFDYLSIQKLSKEKPLSETSIRQKHFERTSLIDFLEQDKENFRIFPLCPNGKNLTAYFQTICNDGADLQILTPMNEIYINNLNKNIEPIAPVNWNVLKLMNVKYIILDKEIRHPYLELKHFDQSRNEYAYLFKDYLPTGFFVKNFKVIPDIIERLKTINQPSFDPAITALLEENPKGTILPPDSSYSKLTSFTPNSLAFDIYTDKPSLYVMSVNYFPDEWIINMDGQEIDKIYKTDHALQSVIVPSGKHKIAMQFVSTINQTSKTITASTSLLLYLLAGGLLLIDFRKKTTAS